MDFAQSRIVIDRFPLQPRGILIQVKNSQLIWTLDSFAPGVESNADRAGQLNKQMKRNMTIEGWSLPHRIRSRAGIGNKALLNERLVLRPLLCEPFWGFIIFTYRPIIKANLLRGIWQFYLHFGFSFSIVSGWIMLIRLLAYLQTIRFGFLFVMFATHSKFTLENNPTMSAVTQTICNRAVRQYFKSLPIHGHVYFPSVLNIAPNNVIIS